MNFSNWTFKKVTATILFGAIIFVFAMFGVNNSQHLGDLGGAAAIVEGTPISIAQFRERMNQLEMQYKWMADMGGEEGRKRFGQQIRMETMRSLIQEEVLSQAARKEGVLVSDAELREQITRLPFLLDNGAFKRERYDLFLKSRNMRAEDFEQEIRKSSVRSKLIGLAQGAFWPTPEEAQEFIKAREFQYKIRVLDVSQLSPSADKVTNVEAKNFLSNQDNQKQVEAYYQSHTMEFAEPEKVRARHILIKVDDKRDEAAAKKTIEEIAKRLKVEDFGTVARQVSEDGGTKAMGGDLNYFARGQMVDAFEKVAFEAKAGEVSAPFRTEFGFHIMKVEDKKAAHKMEFPEAQTVIAKKMIAEKAMAEALAKRNMGYIEQAAKSKNLKWEEIGPFDLSQGIPRMNRADTLLAYLSGNAQNGLVPFVVADGSHRYVVDVKSREKNKNFEKIDMAAIGQQVTSEKLQSNIGLWLEQEAKSTNIKQNSRLLQ